MGAQSRGVLGGRGAGLDHHRAVRIPGNEAGAGDIFRRAGLRRPSILVGLAAFVAIWQNGSRGMGRVLLAFAIDALVLAYPAYLGLQYRKLPPIHDITTDPIDPPRFDALARLRSGDGANPAVYAGLYSAEQQRQAYPDIEPVELDTPVQRAYDVDAADRHRRKWLVIDERPPQPPRRIGHIEAVARTPIMGFREDVSIRVTRRRRRFAGRYPLVLALFRKRSRQQRRARHQADRRHQRRRRQRQSKPAKKPATPVKAAPKVVKK